MIVKSTILIVKNTIHADKRGFGFRIGKRGRIAEKDEGDESVESAESMLFSASAVSRGRHPSLNEVVYNSEVAKSRLVLVGLFVYCH
jgi:hypothetical protein